MEYVVAESEIFDVETEGGACEISIIMSSYIFGGEEKDLHCMEIDVQRVGLELE
jgi:hypothetical protein